MANYNYWPGVGHPRYRGNHAFAPYPINSFVRGRGRGASRGRVRGGVHHNRTLVNDNSSAVAVPPPDHTNEIDMTDHPELLSSPAATSPQLHTVQSSIISTLQATNQLHHAHNHQPTPQQIIRVKDVQFTVSTDGRVLTRITRKFHACTIVATIQFTRGNLFVRI
jgi:hypothetical protein